MSASAPVRQRPRGFQFRLGTLLAAMVWVGLVCLALRAPTVIWAEVIFDLTILILLTCVLVVVYRAGRTRAFAVGFLVFSVGYLACLALMTRIPVVALRRTPVQGAAMWLFDRVHPASTIVHATPGSAGVGPTYGVSSPYDPQDFGVICNLAITYLLGALGGIVAQVLYATRREEAAQRA